MRAEEPTATLPLPVTLTLYFLTKTLRRLLGTAKVGILRRILFVTKSFQLRLLPINERFIHASNTISMKRVHSNKNID